MLYGLLITFSWAFFQLGHTAGTFDSCESYGGQMAYNSLKAEKFCLFDKELLKNNQYAYANNINTDFTLTNISLGVLSNE